MSVTLLLFGISSLDIFVPRRFDNLDKGGLGSESADESSFVSSVFSSDNALLEFSVSMFDGNFSEDFPLK